MKIKSLFKIFKNYISNLWSEICKNPIYYRLILEPKHKKRIEEERIEEERKRIEEERIEEERIEEERKKIVYDFEEKQKTSIARIKEIMYHEKAYHETTPKLDYLNNKLVEGRMHVIEMSPFIRKTPFFYEPEICEIHNETLTTKKNDIHNVILRDNKIAEELLKKQKLKTNSLYKK